MDEIEYGATVAAQEEYEVKNIASAFIKAQAEIESAIKDKKNPAFRSTYADLLAVIEAIKPSLAKHGLGFIQEVTERDAGGIYVETVILHSSGEMLRTGKLPVPVSKMDAHGYGSAITYGKRYSLMACFGVPAEDDDGNAAVKAAKNDTTPYVSPERAAIVRRVADACIAAVASGNDYGAYEEASHIDETDEKLLLWQYLAGHSKVRSAIKAQADMEKHGLSRALAP